MKGIAAAATEGDTVRLPAAAFQPLAADDVAKVVARTAVGSPLNGTIEVAGPEKLPFDQFISRGLKAQNDPREIIVDADARYFGTQLSENSLVPVGDGALIGQTCFAACLFFESSQQPT